MRPLYVEQGVAQLHSLISILRSDTPATKLALIAVSWAQLLAGVSYPILSQPDTDLPHLDPMKWIPAIRKCLSTTEVSLELAQTFVKQLQQENDEFIMERAMSMDFMGYELRCI